MLCGVAMCLGAAPASSQTAPTDSTARIRLFINCRGDDCFEDFFKTELSFFQTVRDLVQADVQIFLVDQETAGGGERYTLRFIGQKGFAGIIDSTVIVTEAATTEANIRAQLLAAISNGLAPYVMRTPWRNEMRVTFPTRTGDALLAVRDPWRAWVFTLGISGNVDGESNRRAIRTENYGAITRITPTHKTVMNMWYEATRTRITYDTTDVKVTVSSGGLRPYYAHSLGPKWSVGIFGSVWYDRYRNIRLHYRLAPAVEYNIFPHSENTRRQLRIGYQAGLRRYEYYDTTIYNVVGEWRPYQQLAVVAAAAQPWGSLSGLLQYNSFFNNLRQDRYSARLQMSIRLARGLNFTVDGSGSIVNDQISLSKRVASEEQLLLRGQQLPTAVLYEIGVGLNLVFGSTNNSIVNPRFEGIDD
jgi:hypothetical protein